MRRIASILLTLVAPAAVFAGQSARKAPFDPFAKGCIELQLAAGSGYGVVHKPDVNFVELDGRCGWMLTSPSGSSIFRGNWELLLGLTDGIVFDGPGDNIVAGTLLLRYNFIQPESKWVPYVQVGAGGAWNDIHREGGAAARLLGDDFTFHLHAAGGVRRFIRERFALTCEFDWHHFSTANTSRHNLGLNTLGGTFGASWFF